MQPFGACLGVGERGAGERGIRDDVAVIGIGRKRRNGGKMLRSAGQGTWRM